MAGIAQERQSAPSSLTMTLVLSTKVHEVSCVKSFSRLPESLRVNVAYFKDESCSRRQMHCVSTAGGSLV